MSLTPGTILSHYEILSKLGEGGMGEVYRARDTQLDRDVALKILPPILAADPERLARFAREAKTLAALNHPNIAAIYGVEKNALVMELVPGRTLEEIIQHQQISGGGLPLPIDQVVRIASQIAEGLEAAHEAGIVHRDLKPANIKQRDDDVVKLLDFGLARAMDSATAASSPSMDTMAASPTMLSPAVTQQGIILGTAGYMSPEQARGRVADKRADIWAFGVVLYELLTGKRLFGGETVTEVIATVIKDAPRLDSLPADTPSGLRALLARCLERDPKARLRDIGEARLVLGDPERLHAAGRSTAAASSTKRNTSRIPWLAAGLASGLVIGALGWQVASNRRGPIAPGDGLVGRFQLTLPPELQLSAASSGSLSVSPDGRTLVVVVTTAGGSESHLGLRALDSTNVKALPGTERATMPFWSPDGADVAFFAEGKLRRLNLRTSAVTTIADAPNPGGGTWNAEGTIVFAPVLEGALFRVSAAGGTASQLTTLNEAEGESNHMWPHFLPDGRRYLFQVLGLNNRGIYAGTLDSSERTLIVGQKGFDMTAVQYSASGHIVYVRNHQLVARRFDVDRLSVSGDEIALADGFGIGGPGRPQFTVSLNGILAFRPDSEGAIYQPTWYSRSGVAEGTLGPKGAYNAMELSSDGRTLALDQFTERESSVWLLDLEHGTSTRFTADSYSVDPVWFPAGDRIAYVSVRDTPPNPFVRTFTGVETRLARLPKAVLLGSVSRDGANIIGQLDEAGTQEDLWLFPTAPNATPALFLRTPFSETSPQLSPDDRWVAFTSDENGTNQIYVTTFPKAGRRYPVSTELGTNARWSADGKDIYFRSRLRLMAATFSVSASGEPVIGKPRELFSVPEGTAGNWVVTKDGRRFLFNVRITPRQAAPMTVVLNWPQLAAGK